MMRRGGNARARPSVPPYTHARARKKNRQESLQRVPAGWNETIGHWS
jgi:hypothetical protein